MMNISELVEKYEAKLAPSLFSEISELYKVTLPVYLARKVYVGGDGKLKMDDNLNPLCILIAQEDFRVNNGRSWFSVFNSKIFTLMHELMHSISQKELRKYIKLAINSKFRNHLYIVNTLFEITIDSFAAQQYKKLRPFIKRQRYEWKSDKRPTINLQILKESISKELFEIHT